VTSDLAALAKVIQDPTLEPVADIVRTPVELDSAVEVEVPSGQYQVVPPSSEY
jgi:hypothetical protein